VAGGIRTLTQYQLQEILSLQCLPFHHSHTIFLIGPNWI
jgi:hypothetical protein